MTIFSETDLDEAAFVCPRCRTMLVLGRSAVHETARTVARRQETLLLPEHSFDPNRDLNAFNRCPLSGAEVARPVPGSPEAELVAYFDPTPVAGVTYQQIFDIVAEEVRASCWGGHSDVLGSCDSVEIDGLDDAAAAVLRLLGAATANDPKS